MKCLVSQQESLRGVEPSRGTNIPTAIINAVTQLSSYTCVKLDTHIKCNYYFLK